MKKGDKVWMDGYIGTMAQQHARECIVEDIDIRYDELTGEKYNICLVDGDWYDCRNGSCHSNKQFMYYIEIK